MHVLIFVECLGILQFIPSQEKEQYHAFVDGVVSSRVTGLRRSHEPGRPVTSPVGSSRDSRVRQTSERESTDLPVK